MDDLQNHESAYTCLTGLGDLTNEIYGLKLGERRFFCFILEENGVMIDSSNLFGIEVREQFNAACVFIGAIDGGALEVFELDCETSNGRNAKQGLAEFLEKYSAGWSPDFSGVAYGKSKTLADDLLAEIDVGNANLGLVKFHEKCIDGDERTYIVTEWCPNCESEVEMRWNTDTTGYEAFCPVCGKRLMLCDECQHSDNPMPCDYNRDSDSCHKRRH